MNTPTLLPTLLHEDSRIAKVDAQVVKLALRSANIIEAFKNPTVAMAVKELGKNTVLIEMTVGITKAMADYFSPEQRMDPAMCVAFAETIIEDYPHESVGDVTVFIKLAGRAKYGELQDDGSVINRGKTYGRLQLTTLMEWWRQYLGEKADEIAKVRERDIKALNDKEAPIANRVVEIMKEEREKSGGPDLGIGRRVDQLLRTVQHMSDDRLRRAWEVHTTERERMIILKEANKRGLVQKRIEDHLSNTKEE